MKMFIPHPQQMIRLTEDWVFNLYPEGRNSDLMITFGVKFAPYHHYVDTLPVSVTLPKGTVLKIERLYIRGSSRDYDSITFRTVASPDGRLANKKNGGTGHSHRFWAKLSDVNEIEFEHVEELA